MASDSYELLDHTADIGIRVRGADPEAVFAAAARALVDLHTDESTVEERLQRRVTATGLDAADLLRHWLRELHYLYETERLLLPRARILELSATRIEADCAGEAFDPARHEARGEIKAVTHHGLRLWEEADDTWVAEVIFDL